MEEKNAPPGAAEDSAGHTPERRKNLRLRMLIDDLKAGIEQNRRALEMQSLRIDKLTGEIEVLKRARGVQVRDSSKP